MALGVVVSVHKSTVPNPLNPLLLLLLFEQPLLVTSPFVPFAPRTASAALKALLSDLVPLFPNALPSPRDLVPFVPMVLPSLFVPFVPMVLPSLFVPFDPVLLLSPLVPFAPLVDLYKFKSNEETRIR